MTRIESRSDSATLLASQLLLPKMSPLHRAEVAEWQTRRIQNPVSFTGCVGSTPTFGTLRRRYHGLANVLRTPVHRGFRVSGSGCLATPFRVVGSNRQTFGGCQRDAHPSPSRGVASWPVELQGDHRRATNGRQSDEFGSVVRPAKMILPTILARIEQRHFVLRQRIDGSRSVRFSLVTFRACQPKILLDGQAAFGRGPQVFDLQFDSGDRRRHQVVPTALFGTPSHFLPQLYRDGGRTHGRSNLFTSKPRCFKIAAAFARMSWHWSKYSRSFSDRCFSAFVSPTLCALSLRSAISC